MKNSMDNDYHAVAPQNYNLQPPLTSLGGATVSYKSPYSFLQPINSVPPMTFDSNTGDMCFTAQQKEVTVMAIKVSEYRNGLLIGSTIRDMQIDILDGNNSQPVIGGIIDLTGGSSNNSYIVDSACANQEICFSMSGFDPDGDSLTMNSDDLIPNSSFTISDNNTISPKGTFCWTPSPSDVRVEPYNFVVRLHDNHCPYYSSSAAIFKINLQSCLVGITAYQSKKPILSIYPNPSTNREFTFLFDPPEDESRNVVFMRY